MGVLWIEGGGMVRKVYRGTDLCSERCIKNFLSQLVHHPLVSVSYHYLMVSTTTPGNAVLFLHNENRVLLMLSILASRPVLRPMPKP